MTDPCDETGARRSPVKREAIVEAALRVFLREGYARASVDAIAADAGVSKRTIYNHFADKRDLFATIVERSSAALVADHARIAERHLVAAEDARAALTAFGDEWLSAGGRRADHGALVRLLISEAAHFPEAARVWTARGPDCSLRSLAAHLRAMADRGLLDLGVGEEETAAGHYVALVRSPVNNRAFFGALPLPEAEVRAVVRSGVDAFLRIHGAAVPHH
ncbi:TetR/AcrR family transcriptional regulator [Nocardiopsis sp. MG754419]|uniref:TetR/AcrR family transcriptional regulator n=1 Tax=Nocardiopsis sp. MG754419 TaxID=2259865 RepID=UPI001BAA8A48|nr:TetR/AcrR family transcriptional regulator [Nocardiopsis sp. MG754419]MBR8743639.1 TetR family transcriptional regulator [Nocardiopsis sp. MG754419]